MAAWLHVPTNMRLTECLESVLKEQRPQCLPALLANYREHGVFPTQGSSGVAGLVGCSNAKLSTSKTKLEGLCLLSVLVKDSSTEVFQQHCLSWLRSLQQVIQARAPGAAVQLAVSVLADLLQYSAMLPELAREVGLNWVLGVLTSLLGLHAECELSALEGMAACMTHYPRACGSLRDKLGAYFLARITSTNPTTQEMACRCYGRLPCLGGVLERGGGTSRADAWANQLHGLLASANSALAQIYQGTEAEGTVQYEGPGLELSFPGLDQSDPLLLLELQHRYRATCLALKHTLSADPNSAVVVPVRQVLNLVCRALSVSPRGMSVTGDGGLRLLVLPAVHSSTLTVLSALITVVRGGLVQYAAVLQKLFSQTLSSWTPASETSVGQQKAFSAVRVSVYAALELWVKVSGASASPLQGSPAHSELLLTHLLGDITPPGAEAVKLRAGQPSMGEMPSLGGKPGPRRSKPMAAVAAAHDGTPSLQRKADLLANQESCLMALKVLRRIVLTSGSLLKEDVHKRLHDVVLPLCVRLQQQQQSGRCAGTAEASGQYASSLTRRELYRLLLALVLVPSARWPAPLSCAVSILSRGSRERSLQVSSFCGEALTVCNALLHPRTPSLSLPLKLPPGALPPHPQSQGPPSGLPLAPMLGGPAPGPAFPARHPLGLPGSLENHLSMGSSLARPDPLLSPPAPPPEALGQRPVFVRYDQEEAQDVEISLASDSDDSVVIVPPGALAADGQRDEAAFPPAPPPPDGGGGSAASAVSAGAADGLLLPADLPSSSSSLLLAAAAAAGSSSDGAALNSFPSAAMITTLAPAPGPGPEGGAPGGGGGAQLQQMLMQPPGPPPGPLLTPGAGPNRHLHGTLLPPPGPPAAAAAAKEDSAVININSSDEEEEEEDMDEDELGEEEAEGGIEEVQTNRASFGAEQGERLQEVESIGVMEEARGAEVGDDPTMPQILCVTGGSLEEREEEEEEEEDAGPRLEQQQQEEEEGGALEEEQCWRPSAEALSLPPLEEEEEEAAVEALTPPHPTERPSAQEAAVCAEQPCAQPEGPPTSQGPSGSPEPEGPAEGAGADPSPSKAEESDGADEEGKGLKRKREEDEEQQGCQVTEKKVDDGVASMLADFIACPPDEEDCSSRSSLPCLD